MRRFGIGQATPRSEDRRFVTGNGRYTADIAVPGQAYAVLLRSPHAHAAIGSIATSDAEALSGVLLVATAADLEREGCGDIPCAIPVKAADGRPLPSPGRPLLARGRVRFVGEPVALVVAETLAAARDAAEWIAVDYRPLAALATVEDVLDNVGSVSVWEDAADNTAMFWQSGDAARVDQALAAARHVVRLDLVNNRVIPCPMEARAATGLYDSVEDRYTLYTSSQGAHQIKEALSRHTLRVPEEKLRVVVPDVGGGFGTKIFHYPEEALVLWASRRTGRPVKWVADRSEAFTSDTHGRDHRNRVTAGFDADGRLLALRVETVANLGAYLNEFGPAIPSMMTGLMLSGAYAIPAIHATCRGVYTNTTPIDAYRGAGRPEATYLVERMMDAAARELGLAPDEIRRRNFISPSQMPYKTAAGPVYDSGNFARNLDDALAAADWAGFAARRAEAKARGRLRGIGLSSYVEICGFDEEEATLRCGADGIIELLIGTQSTGQGHETAYAQIVVEQLGVPFESVHVLQGDTDRIPFGKGTSGSRSLPVGGPAVRNAADALIARAGEAARQLLQAGDREVAFAQGRFTVVGSERSIALPDIAAALAESAPRPAGEPAPALQASGRYKLQASTFPNGTHVCEVEVDPETGVIEVVGYHVVDDFGTIVNPLLLEGQVLGGIAQGIGQALFEHAVYDRESGQLLTGSFADYGLPRAFDMPPVAVRFNSVPCATNPLGIKGAGEAGTIGACPAVVNAVLDALAPLGVTHVDMPLTPEKIWRAVVAAQPSPQERSP